MGEIIGGSDAPDTFHYDTVKDNERVVSNTVNYKNGTQVQSTPTDQSENGWGPGSGNSPDDKVDDGNSIIKVKGSKATSEEGLAGVLASRARKKALLGEQNQGQQP